MPSAPGAPSRASSEERLILRSEVGGKGRGVFAVDSFRAGEEVLEFLGERRDVSTFDDLTHALQISATTFLAASGGIDDYVNHSCEPNTGIREVDGRVILFALRDLSPGDEITFDYATTQGGGHWQMTCQCGTRSCRGTIRDFDDIPKKRRDEFIRLGAVLPFLIEGAKKKARGSTR